MLPDLITRIILGEEYRAEGSLWSPLNAPVTSSLQYLPLYPICCLTLVKEHKATNKGCSSVNAGQSKILIYFHKHQSRNFEQ